MSGGLAMHARSRHKLLRRSRQGMTKADNHLIHTAVYTIYTSPDHVSVPDHLPTLVSGELRCSLWLPRRRTLTGDHHHPFDTVVHLADRHAAWKASADTVYLLGELVPITFTITMHVDLTTLVYHHLFPPFLLAKKTHTCQQKMVK